MRRAMSMVVDASGPIANSIRAKVEATLNPVSLRIINESHKHSNHWVADGSPASDAGETHFKLEIVSEAFTGISAVKRHQRVYALLDDELKAGVHALSMTTKTPEEAANWEVPSRLTLPSADPVMDSLDVLVGGSILHWVQGMSEAWADLFKHVTPAWVMRDYLNCELGLALSHFDGRPHFTCLDPMLDRGVRT